MTIQVRAVTAPVNTGSTSVAVNKPTGTLEGDLMVMFAATRVLNEIPAYPAGWTEIPMSYLGTSNRPILLYRVAGASEPSSYTVTVPSGTSSATGIVTFYSDAASPIKIDAFAITEEIGTLTTVTWPTLTISAAGLVAYFANWNVNFGGTPTAGYTERWDGGGGSPRSYLMTKPEAGAGTIIAATVSTLSATNPVTIALALVESALVYPAGPQFRAGASATGTVDGSQSVTIPSDAEAGDLAVLSLTFNADKTPTLPAGWTALDAATTTGANGLFVFTRTLEAGDAGATVTATFAAGSVTASMVVGLWQSLIGAPLLIEDVDAQSNASSVNVTFPSLTTTHDDGALVFLAAIAGAGNYSPAPGYFVRRYVSRLAMVTSWSFAVGAVPDHTDVLSSARTTIVAALVIVEDLTPTNLDASLVTFFRVQAAQQSAFGTAVEPAFALPVVFDYQQGDVEQLAQWDEGSWTPLEIMELVASFATFKLRGVLCYELLPVLLNAGFGAMTPSGMGPYSYAGSGGPSAVGAPSPYTFRFGGNQGSGGSMVQIADAYLNSLTLTFNLNDKIVTFESEWFGRFVDDNGGAGYAPAAVALPDGLRMVNGLLATVGVQDATATGGVFDDLTAFECALIEWQLQIDTGLRPAWSADKNALTYCGVRHEEPSAVWSPHLRTTLDNYALVLTKAQQRTYQELQIALSDTDRALTLQMTGRFVGKTNAHERTRGEVVMKPTFVVRTSHDQVNSSHWMDWAITAGWEHGA